MRIRFLILLISTNFLLLSCILVRDTENNLIITGIEKINFNGYLFLNGNSGYFNVSGVSGIDFKRSNKRKVMTLIEANSLQRKLESQLKLDLKYRKNLNGALVNASLEEKEEGGRIYHISDSILKVTFKGGYVRYSLDIFNEEIPMKLEEALMEGHVPD